MPRKPPLRRLIAIPAVIALALAGMLAAPLAAQATPVTSTVTGSVADPASVVDGDTVYLYEDAPGSGFSIFDTTSMSGGTFTFNNESLDTDNTYAVFIDTSASGYEAAFSNGSVLEPVGPGSPGTLVGAATLDFGVIAMPALITVSGTVTDANGPVRNAVVALFPVGYDGAIAGGVTNRMGIYHAEIPTGLDVVLGVEVPFLAATGHAVQFWSGKSGPGLAGIVTTVGAPGDDLPGYDFSLTSLNDTINIVSSETLPGCGCGPFPETTAHLYVKSGAYWLPVSSDGDQGILLAAFMESTPGDYRLRFTDGSGHWLAIDPTTLADSGTGSYSAPTTDGCEVEIDGLALGDQPSVEIDLLAPSSGCVDEPPPPPTPAVVIKKHSVSTPTSEPTATATPSPTPTPTRSAESESPTPEPSVTTQGIPTEPTSVNLSWLWWALGAVLLAALVALALFLFRRRP